MVVARSEMMLYPRVLMNFVRFGYARMGFLGCLDEFHVYVWGFEKKASAFAVFALRSAGVSWWMS